MPFKKDIKYLDYYYKDKDIDKITFQNIKKHVENIKSQTQKDDEITLNDIALFQKKLHDIDKQKESELSEKIKIKCHAYCVSSIGFVLDDMLHLSIKDNEYSEFYHLKIIKDNYGRFVLHGDLSNKLLYSISLAHNEIDKLYEFWLNYRKRGIIDLKLQNSDFYLRIFSHFFKLIEKNKSYSTSEIISITKTTFEKYFAIESYLLDIPNYIVDYIKENEQLILNKTFIKIKDLPLYMQKDLSKVREEQVRKERLKNQIIEYEINQEKIIKNLIYNSSTEQEIDNSISLNNLSKIQKRVFKKIPLNVIIPSEEKIIEREDYKIEISNTCVKISFMPIKYKNEKYYIIDIKKLFDGYNLMETNIPNDINIEFDTSNIDNYLKTLDNNIYVKIDDLPSFLKDKIYEEINEYNELLQRKRDKIDQLIDKEISKSKTLSKKR